jgi:hypothetical protein
MVMEEGLKNIEDGHIGQSSNVKLFGVQRRKETTKPLQLLQLKKALFNWHEHKAGISKSVNERNSLNQRNDDF